MRVVIVGMGGVTATFRHWPERILGRALVERGHHVANVAFRDPRQPALSAREEMIDGIEVRRVPIRHAPNNVLYRALDELAPFDIMHLMHPRNVLAYGAVRWARRHGIPTVYTWLGPFHDRYVIEDRERPYDDVPTYERIIWSAAEVARRTARNGRIRDHLRNYWLHWPLKVADTLLPCSEHEAQVLRAMGLHQPCEVVPLWIDTDAIRDVPMALPSTVEDRSGPVLLFIGQLTPRKGYDLLVRALPRVLERHPTTTVQIVSGLNTADRQAMEEMARALGLVEHVTFLGRVEDAVLINLFRAADIYVTPTRYEGFGLTLLEAMAAGNPIIASDIPVVDEIIQHGENGWLVPYDDPDGLAAGIMRLLDDPELRRRLVAGGEHALRERFYGPALARRVEAVYRATLERRALGAHHQRGI
jgi:glycosyltransferase involved in cell wall biosynthesis